MAVPIIPRFIRDRLYFEIGPVLFPAFAQAHRLDIVDVGGGAA